MKIMLKKDDLTVYVQPGSENLEKMQKDGFKIVPGQDKEIVKADIVEEKTVEVKPNPKKKTK